MLHITHFILIVSLAVGIAAVTVSAQIYRKYRLDYLRAHLAIVICFNLMILISMVSLYVFNLPRGAVSRQVETAAGIGYEFLVPLLQLLAAYFFLRIIWGMLEKRLSAGVKRGAWTVISGYAVIQAAATATGARVGGMRLTQVIGRFAWFLSIGLILTVLVGTVRWARDLEDSGKRKAVTAYWILLMGLLSVVITLIILQNYGILTITRYNFITALLIAAMNAVPILYLGWFAGKYHYTPLDDLGVGSDLKQVSEKYGITPREQEIIRLISGGLTNREIAEELFISHQTVKDHVYRIFRKTGVKNRVQLVNLFITSAGKE